MRLHRAGAMRICAAVFTVFLVIAAFLPPRFAATATLAVLPAPEFTVRQDAGSHAFASNGLAMEQVMKAETAILESDALHDGTLRTLDAARLYPDLDPAVQRSFLRQLLHDIAGTLLAPWRPQPADRAAALHEAALAQFAAALTVLPAKDANVITVTFHHRDGALAAQAVNTMLARYADRRSKLYDDPQLNVVRRQTEAAAHEVADADAALAAFKAAHVISDFTAQRDLLLHRQSETDAALAAATSAAAEQHARLLVLNLHIARLQKAVPLYNEADTDTRLQPIDAALVDLRGKLATAREQYRDTSRKVIDLRAQIVTRESERAQIVANPAPSAARTGRSEALDPLLVDRAHAAADAAAGPGAPRHRGNHAGGPGQAPRRRRGQFCQCQQNSGRTAHDRSRGCAAPSQRPRHSAGFGAATPRANPAAGNHRRRATRRAVLGRVAAAALCRPAHVPDRSSAGCRNRAACIGRVPGAGGCLSDARGSLLF